MLHEHTIKHTMHKKLEWRSPSLHRHRRRHRLGDRCRRVAVVIGFAVGFVALRRLPFPSHPHRRRRTRRRYP